MTKVVAVPLEFISQPSLPGTVIANTIICVTGKFYKGNNAGTEWIPLQDIKVGTTAPIAPQVGDLWIDTN